MKLHKVLVWTALTTYLSMVFAHPADWLVIVICARAALYLDIAVIGKCVFLANKEGSIYKVIILVCIVLVLGQELHVIIVLAIFSTLCIMYAQIALKSLVNKSVSNALHTFTP